MSGSIVHPGDQSSAGSALEGPFLKEARPLSEPILSAALRQLYQIADELDAEICEQTLDKAEDDLPDDAELTVNITAKQFRQLTQALHTAALALGRAA